MSTWLDIMAFDASNELVSRAAEQVAALEQRWSRFIPTSEICQLNAALGSPVRVSQDTLTLIATMTKGHAQTGGRFDPTILPALVDAGYYASIDDAGAVTVLPADAASAGPRLSHIVVDREASTISLPPGLTIDPGGIGKGLAADLVVAELIAAGATGAMVSLGGDIAVAGTTPDHRGWPVQINDPYSPSQALAELAISSGGLATSSSTTRSWLRRGSWVHHTIDPTTNRSAVTDIASVTVIANSAAEAEIHATAALILGSTDGLDYLECRGLHGLLCTTSQAVLATKSLAVQWHPHELETSH